MVSTEARQHAATLLDEFRRGANTFDDVDNSWPTDSGDEGLDGIIELLYGQFGDDYKAVRLTEGSDQWAARAVLLERASLFLRSRLEYTWPERVPGRGFLAALQEVASLGSWDASHRKEWEAFARAGDIDVWPFRTREDHAQVERLSRPDPRQ